MKETQMNARQVYEIQREADETAQRYHYAASHPNPLPTGQAVLADMLAVAHTAEEAARKAQKQIGGKVFRVADLAGLSKKIERFQRKADKLGSGEIKMTVTDEKDTLWFPVEPDHPGFDPQAPEHSLCAVYSVTYYYVILSGEAPKLPGWEFVATLEHTEAGNIVHEVPTWNMEELASEYNRDLDLREWRQVEPRCEHCNLDRDRKDTFLVREEATGAIKQVGRNCLADFTGINDPMRAAKLAEHYANLLLDGFGEDDEEVHRGARQETAFPAEEFIAQAAAFVRVEGYKKSDWGQGGTGAAAWDSLLNYGRMWNGQPEYLEIEDEDRFTAKRVREWAEAIPADTTSDYLSNVRIAVLNDFVTWRQKGIVASAVTAFQRDEQKRVERELHEQAQAERAEKPESEFLGESKERLRDVTLTVTYRRYFPGDYDNPFSKTLLKFETDEGHKLEWWATSEPFVTQVVQSTEDTDGDYSLERHLTEGDKIKADFTVKAHKESDKWGKTTVVTRLTVKDVVELVAD